MRQNKAFAQFLGHLEFEAEAFKRPSMVINKGRSLASGWAGGFDVRLFRPLYATLLCP
ncbi:hypothetical protein X742_14845 [Mesorhizobium sp. LNHC232B00]|nr:hypothetical protein X742_14845 [Mesorhizobium sp. LNHC232B00]